jgi:hypothetical protein
MLRHDRPNNRLWDFRCHIGIERVTPNEITFETIQTCFEACVRVTVGANDHYRNVVVAAVNNPMKGNSRAGFGHAALLAQFASLTAS